MTSTPNRLSIIILIAFIAYSHFVAAGMSMELPDSCGADDGAKEEPADVPAAVWDKAKKGDVFSQTVVGEALLTGRGAIKNSEEGAAWLKKAAEKNSGKAQYLLGKYLFERAEAGEGSYATAISLIAKSADRGYPQAEAALGAIYLQGKAVKQDPERAYSLLVKAAEAGDFSAQIKLGTGLVEGVGFRKEPETGFAWIQRAADSGSCLGKLLLASFYAQGLGTAKNPEQAQKIMESLYARGGDMAKLVAYFYGCMYMEDKYGMTDRQEAIRWLMIAAKYKIADSETRLAQLMQGKSNQGQPQSH